MKKTEKQLLEKSLARGYICSNTQSPRQILHNHINSLSGCHPSSQPVSLPQTNLLPSLTVPRPPIVNKQTLYQTPVPVLSNEESLASVPEAAVLIYMVEAKEVVTLTDHVREDVVFKTS